MNQHFYSDASTSEVMMRALTEGVSLNNQGNELISMGKYKEAIPIFKRALEIKEEAHGLYSVNYCISLSGYADCLMYTGDLDGAYSQARLMLDIGQHIESPEQIRIAREILKDISVKSKRPLLPDEVQGAMGRSAKTPTVLDSGADHLWIEPAAKRCHNFSNPQCPCPTGNSSADLMKCGRCKSVFYCCKECQKSDWKYHKKSCHQ